MALEDFGREGNPGPAFDFGRAGVPLAVRGGNWAFCCTFLVDGESAALNCSLRPPTVELP
jgi:hypothetical protein